MAAASHLPLPLTVEDITSAWLTAALQTQVRGAEVLNSRIVERVGGTSTKIRLSLELNDVAKAAGIPEAVMLKGGFEPHSRGMYHMHLKEVRGYRDVVKPLNLPSPGCYFAEIDDSVEQGIVIIEDLNTRGVSFCHPLRPQTYEQVARRLSELARFHAQTWGSPEFHEGGRWSWLNQYIPVGRGPFFNHYLSPDIWAEYTVTAQAAAASVYFRDAGWASDALDRLVILASRLPHAVLHGDTHLGNLYIDPDGTPGFFDAQPHRWPALVEVTYHVAGALDPADRRRWETGLIQHYIDELRSHGIEAPSLQDAMSQYAAFLAFGYFIFLVNECYFQTSPINTAYVSRFSSAMIDNNTSSVLSAIS